MSERTHKKVRTTRKTQTPVETPTDYHKRLSMNTDQERMDHQLSSTEDIMDFQVTVIMVSLTNGKKKKPLVILTEQTKLKTTLYQIQVCQDSDRETHLEMATGHLVWDTEVHPPPDPSWMGAPRKTLG